MQGQLFEAALASNFFFARFTTTFVEGRESSAPTTALLPVQPLRTQPTHTKETSALFHYVFCLCSVWQIAALGVHLSFEITERMGDDAGELPLNERLVPACPHACLPLWASAPLGRDATQKVFRKRWPRPHPFRARALDLTPQTHPRHVPWCCAKSSTGETKRS